jgi:sortase (surface protein transpeptidase)
LLVAVGLVVALVAVVALVLQMRGGPEVAASTMTPPPTTSAPTTSAAPEADETEATSEAPTSATSPSATPEPEATAAATPSAVPTTPAAQQAVAPSWISIAAGGVDSAIVPQGLAADGTINPGRNQVIWFTGSNRVQPGQVGTAVIAAHVTWEGAPDAFLNLPSVGVGDVVTVGYTDGSSASFTVRETAAVDKEALARSLKVWGPHPGVPRLAIITCDPAFGYQADGHTEANFVVIAEG